jgi:hypothetical protein
MGPAGAMNGGLPGSASSLPVLMFLRCVFDSAVSVWGLCASSLVSACSVTYLLTYLLVEERRKRRRTSSSFLLTSYLSPKKRKSILLLVTVLKVRVYPPPLRGVDAWVAVGLCLGSGFALVVGGLLLTHQDTPAGRGEATGTRDKMPQRDGARCRGETPHPGEAEGGGSMEASKRGRFQQPLSHAPSRRTGKRMIA